MTEDISWTQVIMSLILGLPAIIAAVSARSAAKASEEAKKQIAVAVKSTEKIEEKQIGAQEKLAEVHDLVNSKSAAMLEKQERLQAQLTEALRVIGQMKGEPATPTALAPTAPPPEPRQHRRDDP